MVKDTDPPKISFPSVDAVSEKTQNLRSSGLKEEKTPVNISNTEHEQLQYFLY